MDILFGSFCGSPQLILGGEDGFGEPKSVLDKDGELVLINKFWNMEDEKWDEADAENPKGLGTSVAAVDWDDDGDLDLIQGTYDEGKLYLRINEGSATEPAFALTNSLIKVGEEPMVIKGGVSNPRVADWNGDGLFDIVCGAITGGVFVFENSGTPGSPRFAEMQTLIKPLPGYCHAKKPKAVPRTEDFKPVGPGSSFHIDIVDYDADGDLDVAVGSVCEWQATPAAVQTDISKERVAVISEEISELLSEMRELKKDVSNNKEKEEVLSSDEYKAVKAKYDELRSERSELLDDGCEVGDLIWLFRRK